MSSKLPEEIVKDIDNYMSENHPFIWPKNKQGEDMVQPVGHVNPPFWRKHQKEVAPIRAAAEHYASLALALKDALEMIANINTDGLGAIYARTIAREALSKFPEQGKEEYNG